jgi:hypothetical protein
LTSNTTTLLQDIQLTYINNVGASVVKTDGTFNDIAASNNKLWFNKGGDSSLQHVVEYNINSWNPWQTTSATTQGYTGLPSLVPIVVSSPNTLPYVQSGYMSTKRFALGKYGNRFIGDNGLHALDDTTLVAITSYPGASQGSGGAGEVHVLELDVSDAALISNGSSAYPNGTPIITHKFNILDKFDNYNPDRQFHKSYGDFIVVTEGGTRYMYIACYTTKYTTSGTGTTATPYYAIAKLNYDTGDVVSYKDYAAYGTGTIPVTEQAMVGGVMTNHTADINPFNSALGMFVFGNSIYIISNKNQVWEINPNTCDVILASGSGGPVAFMPGFKSSIVANTATSVAVEKIWVGRGATQKPNCY